MAVQIGRVASGGIDPATWTAIGTIGLALITWRYVVLTNRLAKSAHVAAESGERSASAAERLLLIQLAPVVHLEGLSGSRSGDDALLTFGLRNVGKSAALNITVELGGGLEAIGPRRILDVVEAGESARSNVQTRAIVYDSYLHAAGRNTTVSVRYEDALGNDYRIVRAEDHSSGGLPDVTIRLDRMVDGDWRRLG